MGRKITQKVIAIMILTIMLLAYAATIGIYAEAVYANENSLEVQGVETNNDNVKFDAYFAKDKTKVHEIESKIGEENSIYLWVAVKNAGYLKNAKVEFTSDSQDNKANFKLKELDEKNKTLAKVNTDANVVELNQISKNQESNIQIPICFDNKDKITIDQFSRENKAKLTGIYVDANGKEKQISSEIILKLDWTEKAEVSLEEQITKYTPYDINNLKGVMLQTLVKTSITNNILPVKNENIEIKVPTIAGIKPTSVKVGANTTKAANNDINGITFTQENYTYDEDKGILSINVQNTADEQNNVTWVKNAQDEIIITYTYDEKVLENMPEEGNKITLETKSNITAYAAKEISLEKTIKNEVTLKDAINNIVDFEVSTNVEELSKGYIYANYDAQEKIETEYQETIVANIGNSDLTDSIVLYSNVDNFVQDENTKGATTVNNVNYAYAKELKIEKEIFDKFISEEGYINLYKGETLISTINKDNEVNEENNIVVDLSEFDVNELTIQTSKPKTEGKLKIEITKALKGDIGYNKNQMKQFTSLEVIASGKAVNNNVVFNSQTVNKNIGLKDPKSVAELVINNRNLSTIVTNENVEIRAILKTNSLDYNLYKNPSLNITLPSYIESINVKSAQVLFNDELKIASASLIENPDKTKSIVIQLEGTQTKYDIGNIAGGANIVLLTDITVNKLTPNTIAEVKMNYTNENVINQNPLLRTAQVEQNETIATLNFTAPTGIVTMNSIAGYKEGAEELVSISGEDKVATIDTMSQEKQATFNMSVMNNYNNTIENVVILGRTPFAGNKKIEKNEDLGSTMNLPLTSLIEVDKIDEDKVKIYYSENGEATKDLNDSSNGWTEDVTDYSKVKSYLIVTNNHVMNTASSITFTYNASIPANLQHNQSAYQTYVVYFTNNLSTGIVEDKQESAKVGVSTGKGAIINATISSNVENGKELLSGEEIRYTVKVTNSGDLAAKNLKIALPVPKNTIYEEFNEGEIEYDPVNKTQVYTLESLEAGQTIEREFVIIFKRLNDEEESKTQEIEVFATITYEGLKTEIVTDTLVNSFKNTYFDMIVEDNLISGEVLKEGEEVEYRISIYNYYETKNTMLEISLPTELEYLGIKKEENELDQSKVSYDKATGKIKIQDLEGKKQKRETFVINAKLKETTEEVYNKNISIKSTISADNIQAQNSEEAIINIVKSSIKMIQTSSIPDGETITNKDSFVYKILIESKGEKIDRGLHIDFVDEFPKELNFEKATIVSNSKEEEIRGVYVSKDNKLNFSTEIQEGTSQEIDIYVSGTVQENDVKVTNKVQATVNNNTIELNSISHTLKATEITDSDDDNSSSTVNRKISGQVWIDENKDAKKDENEQKVQNVQVMLVNNETGNLQEGAITTTEDGRYTFTEVPEGKYTVVFLYDTAKYSATGYRKEGVDETLNSDAIDTQITLDGTKRLAAITEVIEISGSNIYNIDLGLVENPKFDLSLDKTVSKITVQDNTGTKTYDYEDTKLAKRDLVGKQINSTTIIVEYKIKVTNEGAVSGYVKKIADYIPSELKFSSELNRDWYQGENGTIYNASLANTLINPGETKEVTLILTKKLNEEGLGLINNTAEIYEAYNDLGLEDIDSKQANKQTDEDDMSSADILLTVKTGETIMFIGLTLAIISTIAIGAYVIKRKIVD